MELQHTLKHEISLEGVGLHTGNPVKITFKPAPVDLGINFVRVDLEGRPWLKADVLNVLDANRIPRRTSLGKDGFEIHTVEHLLAVLVGLGIDNLIVEINNNEVPGLDGSGLEFIEVIKKAGIEEQNSPRKYFLVKEPVWVAEKDSLLAVFPHPSFKISYTLDYDHPILRSQYISLEINPETFEKEISSFRTFVLQDEVEELKKIGLGKGASYDNTLVVTDDGVIKNQLRSPDEFVRHKVLDLVGDMYLLGMQMKGNVVAIKSGHTLNIKLIKKLTEQKARYELGGVGSNYTFKQEAKELGISQIMQILPHRYPFLLVDRIISLEGGKRAVGIKNVTINDGFFEGHFPKRPVMPGVLIIEAMAQVGGVLMLSQEEHQGKIAYFIAANNIKFRKTVIPGDQLVLEVEVVKLRSKTGQVHTQALVAGKVVAEADLMFTLGES
ncbi:MAG: bifunctional UDP-3-O-[3-hydroxymyristoyl] N-acetylglucosamine deacetylase/3-hydroxyacyl-ACP dehydratase [Candidatus Omnitrophota bacterium]|nr:bifunctional UDP-3-O-[3-hydroxymyristoyl] N-acetylglucosamine deacetylase/3-hydroxyacyl-ACP dehydratase [Candidatus Omnitrophota bacterium]